MTGISTFTRDLVAIVDAVGPGAYLAPAFMTLGYRCIHVKNEMEAPPGGYSFPSEYFVDSLSYDGDLPTLVEALSRHRIAHVVAGYETGVELADALSDALGCPTSNGTALSEARRDKFLMQDVLAKAGLRHAATRQAEQTDALIEWARERDAWPVVVKPARSAGTDGVRICQSLADVADAAARLLDTANIFGLRNERIVAQEFLNGVEYMVNGVSAQGRHAILEIWLSKKKLSGSIPLYDYVDLIQRDTPEHAVISRYVARVLSALGIDYGPSHTEVMLDADGPVLIESAGRMQGNINPASLYLTTGTNQALATAAAYVAPDRFIESIIDTAPHPMRCRVVFLLSPISGVIRRPLDMAPFEALPSFHSVRFRQNVEVGSRLVETIDLLSSVGSIHLVHEDVAQIERDQQAIRALEAENFYARAIGA